MDPFDFRDQHSDDLTRDLLEQRAQFKQLENQNRQLLTSQRTSQTHSQVLGEVHPAGEQRHHGARLNGALNEDPKASAGDARFSNAQRKRQG